jgi:hypothetical protein
LLLRWRLLIDNLTLRRRSVVLRRIRRALARLRSVALGRSRVDNGRGTARR